MKIFEAFNEKDNNMGRRNIPRKIKIHAVKDYLVGLRSKDISKKYGIHKSTLYVWTKKYYSVARRGITLSPSMAKRFGVTEQPYVKEIINDNVVEYAKPRPEEVEMARAVTSIPSEDEAVREVDEMIFGADMSDVTGDTEDVKVTGSFEFVDGKVFSTNLFIDPKGKKIRLTKEMMEFLNKLCDKFLE